MKTEQLIEALVADRAAGRRPLVRALVPAVAAGAALSLLGFLIELGVRADIGPALVSWRFDLKVAMIMLGLVLAFRLCLDYARPEPSHRPLLRLLPLLLVVVAAVALELVSVPVSSWRTRLVGSNSMICLSAMPLLSLAPLAMGLFVLQRGAPASPARAGAAAGLVAALSGASLYAFHCFDDSPLFVATWYTLAALPIVALGALLGHRLLRW
jgi:hypothetical protein